MEGIWAARGAAICSSARRTVAAERRVSWQQGRQEGCWPGEPLPGHPPPPARAEPGTHPKTRPRACAGSGAGRPLPASLFV